MNEIAPTVIEPDLLRLRELDVPQQRRVIGVIGKRKSDIGAAAESGATEDPPRECRRAYGLSAHGFRQRLS